MKKIILSVVLATSQLVMFSQTVNIHFKNGQTIEYPSENVEYVDFSAKASDPTMTAGQAVDLGLSVYWASCNLGAEKPEDYGDYYAWGETKPKNRYKDEDYAYYNSSSCSFVDIGQDIGGTEYDAATVNLGKDWRMPTKDEVKELMNNCTWVWVQINNTNGYKVIGKNGNTIFLPASGLKVVYEAGKNKHLIYWTSSSLNNSTANAFVYLGSEIGFFPYDKYEGLVIRPVTTNPNGGRHP